MKVTELTPNLRDVWDQFVDDSNEAWLWHRYGNVENHANMPRKQNRSFLVTDKEEVLAIVPLHLVTSKRYGMAINILVSQGGPALANQAKGNSRRTLLDFIHANLTQTAKKTRAVHIDISITPMAMNLTRENLPIVNPLLYLGCENRSTQTYVVDLTKGRDLVWQGLETRARTSIRKAEQSGVTVRAANMDTDLDLYYQLHQRTYHRTGARPHPKRYFATIWEAFYGKGKASILLAEKEGEPIAGACFGHYKKRGNYWTGASNEEGLKTGANSLLQWRAMELAIENGAEYFDSGEAFPNVSIGKKDGLDMFKRSFGGELFPYYRGRIRSRKRASLLLDLLKVSSD